MSSVFPDQIREMAASMDLPVDQSGSMKDSLGGEPNSTKMDGAADALNRVLDAISQRCSQGMDIRDYFHVGIITYTTDSAGNTQLETPLPDTTPEQPSCPSAKWWTPQR